MRKSQKNEILSTVGLLDKAHDAFKKAMETGNQDVALTLMEQCQESAIRIGGMIEESEGEDFAAIALLENYCELLYQTYELVRQRQTVNAGRAYKNFRRELIRIENSVKNDIQVRKSVVFLPYKASMWDSLESVWKAADADPDCDACVVPIPYFDKNPDGSFRRMHYEGDQYPDYVPVVSWEEYDLASEHPDVIYIHNPYDECNHVTSVHPSFYARELRKFTDKLVYIPYFILPEINHTNQAAIEGMKHFCFTPGTIYANQVIVQSEEMRLIYINEYLKAAREMGLSGEHVDRKFLEKKFLGTGSPKIEKVLNTRKEDLDIPEEWLGIIEKPDGSWKKIVFYNTSVSALLQHSEKMLRKMEAVFEVFRKNQDRAVLLWRPHPLIQATIESMRPQLWEAYREIRDRYIEEGWGIYDDSAELDRAVILSDKYYGDMSSVAQLYEKCDKPVLIQSIHVPCDCGKRINTQIEAGVVVGDMIYYTIPRYNKFYSTNLRDGETCCIKNTAGRREEEEERFSHATILKDNIFFFSNNSFEYAVLNLETNEIKEKYLKIRNEVETRYLGKYKEKIYLISRNVDEIYEMENDETNTFKINVFQINEEEVFTTESNCWYFEKEKCVLWKIDVLKKTKQNFTYLIGDQLLNESNRCSFVIEKDNQLIFVPDLTDEMFIYDTISGNMRKDRLPECTTWVLGGMGALRYIEGTDDRIFFSSIFSSEIYIWESEGLIEIGRMGIGSEDVSFSEICGDLSEKKVLSDELYMNLGAYINF